MLGAGLSAQLQGKPADAREQLASALRIEPGLTAASLLLGELLYADADLQGAIQVYEQALVFAPNQPRLRPVSTRGAARRPCTIDSRKRSPRISPSCSKVRRINSWRRAWRISSSPPIGASAARWGRIRNAWSRSCCTRRNSFATSRSRRHGPAALTMDESACRSAERSSNRELQRILRHELAHAIVQSVAPRGVPQWLNEGLAVLFEKDDRVARGADRRCADR